MDVNKLPRWVLIFGFIGFLAIAGFTLNGAYADLSHTKSMAEQSKSDIVNLKASIDDIKTSQKSFSDKYDRNQEEDQRVFRQILAAVKQ